MNSIRSIQKIFFIMINFFYCFINIPLGPLALFSTFFIIMTELFIGICGNNNLFKSEEAIVKDTVNLTALNHIQLLFRSSVRKFVYICKIPENINLLFGEAICNFIHSHFGSIDLEWIKCIIGYGNCVLFINNTF